MDVLTKDQRSYCMSQIRGKNTKPELLLRRNLWKLGFRYRVHYSLPGRPDIVFTKKKIAVFVDGCFWHGCPDHGVKPKTNKKFWREKIHGNILRDKRNTNNLVKEGWTVLRFWEHQIKKELAKVCVIIEKVYNRN